ncbi:uncharacterized protein LOC129587866 [Paramacrobiotus metropolitanus]|uniref:uncharacterized protein LOC129587866 n=1 Tax=Paramacrobiotus metropolitanus TaxID=2943436 RepID=UPI00244636BC|nr:uncharacterized protein LOC129587866 [Paramacrobiotus metropolitanus]
MHFRGTSYSIEVENVLFCLILLLPVAAALVDDVTDANVDFRTSKHFLRIYAKAVHVLAYKTLKPLADAPVPSEGRQTIRLLPNTRRHLQCFYNILKPLLTATEELRLRQEATIINKTLQLQSLEEEFVEMENYISYSTNRVDATLEKEDAGSYRKRNKTNGIRENAQFIENLQIPIRQKMQDLRIEMAALSASNIQVKGIILHLSSLFSVTTTLDNIMQNTVDIAELLAPLHQIADLVASFARHHIGSLPAVYARSITKSMKVLDHKLPHYPLLDLEYRRLIPCRAHRHSKTQRSKLRNTSILPAINVNVTNFTSRTAPDQQ